MSEVVAWIDSFDEKAASWAGPKMARLGELHRIGVRVPDAFAIPVACFDRFFGRGGLRGQIDALLRMRGLGAEAALAAAAAQVQALDLSAPLDESDRLSIVRAYAQLARRAGNALVRVAVRSSATREDSTGASFAGQYATVLGVSGADAILRALMECWASFFSTHAIGYRMRNGIDPCASPMAVGVCKLVDARAAGVAFSAHPVSGKRDRCVIEASFGWGEAVVQGLVTPDHVELDRFSGRILDYRIAEKKVLSTFDIGAGRVVEVPMPAERRNERVLSDAGVASLFTALERIEAHYGEPVDVEWVADADDSITIVQTRPITALPKAAAPVVWNPSQYASKYGLAGVR